MASTFNWQTFRTRALTAVVFAVVMLAGLLWNRWSFFLLFSVVHFGAWWEYQKLVSLFNPSYQKISTLHRIVVMVGGWSLLLYLSNEELRLFEVSLTKVGFWMGVAFLVALPLVMMLESKLRFFQNILYSLFGLLYISLPLALMIAMRNRWSEEYYQLSHTIPLLIIFSIWINDTMAYIVGSLIGKTPLSKISPKKTWEGTVGGVILTVVVMMIVAYFTGRLSIAQAGTMAGIAAISGTFGDLFESKLKRMAGVKDSGSIMPGHGGFLDRFDSLLFAAACVWIYTIFLPG